MIRAPMRLKNEGFVGMDCTSGAESEEWMLPLLIRSVASPARRGGTNNGPVDVVRGEV